MPGSLALSALANRLVAGYLQAATGASTDAAEEPDATAELDAAAAAAAAAAELVSLTVKSLSSPRGFEPTNAREVVRSHHTALMEQLQVAAKRQKAGHAPAAGVAPASRIVEQTISLKKLTRALGQQARRQVEELPSPAGAKQFCRMLKLGDEGMERWRRSPRRRRDSSKPRSPPSKRKSPDRLPATRSRFGEPDCIAAPAAGSCAAASSGEPPRRRRSSCDGESGGSGWQPPAGIVPKQLQFGGGLEEGGSNGGAAAQPKQQQPCAEWVAFTAFMAAPPRPAGSAAATAAPAVPAAMQQEGLAGEQPQPQPMNLDSPVAALQVPAPSAAATLPLSPRQPRCLLLPGAPALPPAHKPLLPHATLQAMVHSSGAGRENGPEQGATAGRAAQHAPSVSCAPSLAAVAPHQRARVAADVIAADLLLLLSECDLPPAGPAETPLAAALQAEAAAPAAPAPALAAPPDVEMAVASCMGQPMPPTGSSQGSGQPAAAPTCRQRKQSRPSRGGGAAGAAPAQPPASARDGVQPLAAPARRPVFTLACSSGGGCSSLFRIDRQAVRRQAAALAPHTGGALEREFSFHNLDDRGRAHSILRVLDLPPLLPMGG